MAIKSPDIENRTFIKGVYDKHYEKVRDHSPISSRGSLLDRLNYYAKKSLSITYVLDLGAGAQTLEQEYLSRREGGRKKNTDPIPWKFVTLDIARLNPQDLQAQHPNIQHLTADASRLPLLDESVDIIVSNMGLELMPANTLNEVYRALKPGGAFLANIIHTSIIDSKIDRLSKNKAKTQAHRTALGFWRFCARKENIFYCDTSQARRKLMESNFWIDRIAMAQGNNSRWIEIDLRKLGSGISLL